MRSKLCAQSFAVYTSVSFFSYFDLTLISSMPHGFIYLDVVQLYYTIKLNPDAVKLKGILTQT